MHVYWPTSILFHWNSFTLLSNIKPLQSVLISKLQTARHTCIHSISIRNSRRCLQKYFIGAKNELLHKAWRKIIRSNLNSQSISNERRVFVIFTISTRSLKKDLHPACFQVMEMKVYWWQHAFNSKVQPAYVMLCLTLQNETFICQRIVTYDFSWE